MKRTLFSRLLLIAALLVMVAISTAGCVGVRLSLDQPSSAVQSQGMRVRIVLKNDSGSTMGVQPELKRFAFDRETFFSLWPTDKWLTEDTVELSVVTSNEVNGAALIYPIKLNGEEPLTNPGDCVIGVVSYDDVSFTWGSKGGGLEPSLVCPSTDPGGPSMYIFVIHDDEIEKVKRAIEATSAPEPAMIS